MACDGAHPPRGSVPIRQPFFRPLALCIVYLIFSIYIMKDWARQNLRFTGNGVDFVQSKPLVEGMMAATNETKGPCAAFLKKKGAEPDVRNISWAGSKAVYHEVLWPTAPVDSQDGGIAAGQTELDKWLHTFSTIIMSDADFVRKKPMLQHAVKTLCTAQRDVHQYLADKGFQVGERDEEDAFLGVLFKGQQPAADPVDPAPSSEHDTGPAASDNWRKKGYRRKHASSKKNFVLWCATNPAHPKLDHKPKCDAKVRVCYVALADGEQCGVWQSQVLESHSSTCCYHGWEGKVPPQGDWLAGGVREKVEEAYFSVKTRTLPRLV